MSGVVRLRNESGFDVTEGVQVMLDALVQSMDAGSGFLDYREWCAIRQVAWALGLDPDVVFESDRRHGRYADWPVECLNRGAVDLGLPRCAHPVGRCGPRRFVPWGWPDPALPLTDEPVGVES